MIPQHPAVGIDLGTTYSVVAYIDNTGRPVSIPNELGDILTPSAIFVDDDDVIIGKEAVKAAVMRPAAYAECFKRDMGGATFRRKVCGQNVPPEILSAFILERLKRDAERRLGSCSKAVVTVPAFFDEGRRRMTQAAGRLAGLEVLDIINEPTAAAIAFGRSQGFLAASSPTASGSAQRLLVYDLGGGTFDVTVLEISGTRFRTLATDGDVRLGGKDFDKRLVDHLANRFVAAHGVDPRSDPQDAMQMWMDAQDLKHALSERSKTTTVLFHAGIRMRIEVSRSEFEEMTADLLERTATTASMVIRQAGLEWEQIDRALLVGGATRMPMVRNMLRQLSRKEPDCSQSPDESVAHGAALYAGELLSQESGSHQPSCELVNVNSHSLGVVGIEVSTGRRKNVVLIAKNTPLPARASRVFKTARANQRSVRVRVVEGESDRPEDCIALGECVVRELPPGLPPKSNIEAEYSYAANGRISVVGRQRVHPAAQRGESARAWPASASVGKARISSKQA
ncbi:MAG: Hsp70 family protein [Pirellulaceae bacterium]